MNQYVKIVEWIDPEGEGISTNFSILNTNCYFHEWEDRLFILLYIVIYNIDRTLRHSDWSKTHVLSEYKTFKKCVLLHDSGS